MRSTPILHDPAQDLAHGLRYEADGTRSKLLLPFQPHPDFLLEGAAVSPITRKAVTSAVAMVQRIAPWVSVLIAPTILAVPQVGEGRFQDRDGVLYEVVAGVFFSHDSSVALAAAVPPHRLFRTAAHEAWHAIEKRISDETKATITADLAPSPYGGGAYWDDPEERRARAFDAWTSRVFEGLPAFRASSNLDAVFYAAWTGELAKIIE